MTKNNQKSTPDNWEYQYDHLGEYNYGTVKDFISTLLLSQKKEIPMGVSQWREHGKKYGYWDYFMEQQKKEMIEKIDYQIATGCYLDCQNIDKLLEILKTL